MDEQNGFRKGRSCEDHLFVMTSIIRNRCNVKLDTFAAFIDLRKAFDLVHRDLMLYKMQQNGIDGKFYFITKSLYCDTQACVQLNDLKTEWFNTQLGVRQGDNMSPTLFSIYINDLIVELKNMKCGININGENVCSLLYADDIVLLSENEKNLQEILNYVYNWCKI